MRGKGLVMHGKISALATGSVRTEDVGGGCSEVASKIAKAMRVSASEREELGGGGVEASGAVGLGELWVRRRRLKPRVACLVSPRPRDEIYGTSCAAHTLLYFLTLSAIQDAYFELSSALGSSSKSAWLVSSLGLPLLLLSVSRRHDDSGALSRVRCDSRDIIDTIWALHGACEGPGAGLGSNSLSRGSRHPPLDCASNSRLSRASLVSVVLHCARNMTHPTPASSGGSEALVCGLCVHG